MSTRWSSAQNGAASVDTAWAGVVRITYRPQQVRHRKHSHWYWSAVRADAIEPLSPDR